MGIKIRGVPKGSIPRTPKDWALQLVTLKHPKGTRLAAHYHQPKKRQTARLQEFLFVKRGKVRLDLYGPDIEYFKKIYLTAGQGYLTVDGGFGIQFLLNSELFELKNGPFVEDKVTIDEKK